MALPDRVITREGDLLVCVRNGSRSLIGKAALIDSEAAGSAFGAFMSVLRSNDGPFLRQVFDTALLKRQIEQGMGATINQITNRDMDALLVPWPSSAEERRLIGSVLVEADAMIDSLEQLLTKKRQIKQGAMQELLTGKRRLPGFSGAWHEAFLGALLHSHPDYGINAPAVPSVLSLPRYLRITDIDDEGRFLAADPVSVNHPSAKDYYLCPGDIVFARTGASVGKSYLYRQSDGPLVFAGFLIRVQPDAAKLVPEYLFYFSQTRRYWNWVTLMSMRSGQPGINSRELTSMPVLLPRVDEQRAIASILSDMDTELAALESRLTKARALKQAMAQALLTGRIRLVEKIAS